MPQAKSLEVVTLEPVADLQEARQRFAVDGHIAIMGLHTAAEAAAAVPELTPIFGRMRDYGTGYGEQHARRAGYCPDGRHPAYRHLRETIYGGSLALGHSMEAGPGERAFEQVITMIPGKRGDLHLDRDDLGEVTAIVTVEGESVLDVLAPDSDHVQRYEIKPGVVAYIKGKELPHRGSAGPTLFRTGLALTKERYAAA